MTKKSTLIAFAAVMFTAGTLGFSGVTFAEDSTTTWKGGQENIKNYLKHAPGVMGSVTAISGSTITLTSANNTLYTINASSAKIVKNRNTIITLADIKVGDTIMVQGTVSGTSVTATTIFDGKPVVSKKHAGAFPGIMGTVSATTGSTFSVTTRDAIVYTVTPTATVKIQKGTPAVTATLADIVSGDTVMVRGTVSGTTVTAESIFDGKVLGSHFGTRTKGGKK